MDDRSEIAGLLVEHFPIMEKASSEDWHGFLNAQTGLDIALDEPNSSAFDKWRVALAERGLPVWGISPEKIEEIKARGLALKALEDKRAAELHQTLKALAVEAPLVTAAELLNNANKAV
jgi:hypothetical protein